MTVIKTKTNMVCAYDPQPDDCFVRTYLRSPTERYLLGVQGIDRYDAAVAWAVSMADAMAGCIVVMPVTAAEHIEANQEQIERGLALLSVQERGRLRQDLISKMLEVMRDSDDPALRQQAYGVLQELEVTHDDD